MLICVKAKAPLESRHWWCWRRGVAVTRWRKMSRTDCWLEEPWGEEGRIGLSWNDNRQQQSGEHIVKVCQQNCDWLIETAPNPVGSFIVLAPNQLMESWRWDSEADYEWTRGSSLLNFRLSFMNSFESLVLSHFNIHIDLRIQSQDPGLTLQ